MSTFYLDFENGDDSKDGTTFANRWKTLNNGATAARIGPGDTIRIMGSDNPTSMGMTAAWTNKSDTVTLNSALNSLVDDGESVWTASANVTASKDTITYRTGTGSSSLAIAVAFTTGLVAYKALGSAQDYSGYQGLTFWFYTTVSIAASTLSIRLCSDTAGVTTVNTFALPAIPVANSWIPIYIDSGSALGSSIQSIALYADLDPGSTTVKLDNINTVKAIGNDNLNLRTLIGKNNGTDTWYALREINGTTLRIDGVPNINSAYNSSLKGYYGTTETVTTYKRNLVSLGILASPGSTTSMQDSGTSGNPITYSGGWDRTNMSTQTLETWLDGLTGSAYGLYSGTQINWTTEKLNFVRCNYGMYLPSMGANRTIGSFTANHCTYGLYIATNDSALGDLTFSNCGQYGIQSNACTRTTISSVKVYGTFAGTNSGTGIFLSGIKSLSVGSITTSYNENRGIDHPVSTTIYNFQATSITANDNKSFGVVLDASSGGLRNCTIGSISASNNLATGVYLGASGQNNIIYSITTSGNTNGGVQYGNATAEGEISVKKLNASEATPIYISAALGSGTNVNQGRHSFGYVAGSSTDHRSYFNGGGYTIFSDTTTRHTGSGLAWALTIYNTSDYQILPARFTVAKFAVTANSLCVVTAWVNRSNTALTAKLVCSGLQVAGVDNDVVATASASAGVYEQLTLAFTPTENGVVAIELQAFASASYTVYIDDMTITQG